MGAGSGPTYHLTFDGVDDTLTVAPSASINNLPSGNFTVEFDASLGEGTGVLLQKSPAGDTWKITISSNQLLFQVLFTPEAYVYRISSFSTWSTVLHFAFVYEASPRAMRIYVGGAELAYIDQVTEETGTYVGDSLDLEAFAFGGGSELRWLRISNSARYTGSFTPPSLTVAPASDANTKLLLKIDENTGDPADTSGNANVATRTGATWALDT
jgi:hypothetical protein